MRALLSRAVRWLFIFPFYLCFFLLEAVGELFHKYPGLRSTIGAHNVRSKSFRPGISIIIPERANPKLLGECLKSLLDASQQVKEPIEIVVVVNGSNPGLYSHLRELYKPIQWLFFKKPLWFAGAIRQGLKKAKYDWVYLLNNDMILDPLALGELLKWRAVHVFAIASQIYFKDPNRRREETGWTDFRCSNGLIEIFDALPDDQETVRGTFYAGAGSSLFQKKLLEEFVGAWSPYHPFYWEDVEWGALAWKMGFESLFCPTSRVWHSHRATHLKFFSEEEIDRIFKRNGYQFQLRIPLPGVSKEALFSKLRDLDRKSFLELMAPGTLLGVIRSRLRSFFYPFNESSLEYVRKKYYLQPLASLRGKPVMIMVSPYAIYPPSHGGAVRLHQLILALSPLFRIIVLSDEVDLYSESSLKYFAKLASIHLVGGRTESPEERRQRIWRILNHSHRILRDQLRMLITCYQPALVQIEFIELGRLVEMKKNSIPWVVTLHDVFFPENPKDFSWEDRYELDLIKKYDAIVVCSSEDADLLSTQNVYVVPNGADCDGHDYVSSHSARSLLFMGPFRYPPNLQGIQIFLEKVYPRLKNRIPELELEILGGHGAARIAAGISCFQQEGVTVFDFIEQPRPHLDRCAVTINPLYGIRGASIKLIESLAAGRVCVSTTDGARGFLNSGFASLIVVERIEDFQEPLERLLRDPSYRLGIEQLSDEVLEKLSWKYSGELLMDLYRGLIRDHR